MTDKLNLKVPATVHVHVDNVNTNAYERLLNFCSSLGYEYEIKLHRPVDEKDQPARKPRVVTGEPRLITDEQE
jgi:hypothetical protein